MLVLVAASAPAAGAKGTAPQPTPEGGVRGLWERFPLEDGSEPVGGSTPSDSAKISYPEGKGGGGPGPMLWTAVVVLVILAALALMLASSRPGWRALSGPPQR